MSLVVLDRVGIGFGKKQLVSDLDLRIARHDRIGLIGPNGSGKSTLLRVFAGLASPDNGAVRCQKKLRIGYLPQDIEATSDATVLEAVVDSVPGRAAVAADLEAAQTEMERAQHAADDEAMMAAATWIADVHETLANFDRHHSEYEAHRVLAGLGFDASEHDRPLRELSGGWRMRARLAALLFQRPDLLLLDEPTNHLDLPSVAWFADFLRGYSHGFVLVCHDREFLNEQIRRVVSLEPEGVRQFRGDYEQYTRHRAEQEVVLENQAKNLERERVKAERFIERFRAQANKAKAVQSRIKQLAKLDQVHTFTRRRVMKFNFPPCPRAGDAPLKIENLRKAFGAHVVFEGVDLFVRRGERVGIIGVNGAGKTTLLRTVAGELTADGGGVQVGHRVEIGYYAQHHADTLDPSKTIFEYIAAHNDALGATAVRTLLGAFLFSDDDVDKPIRVLSGGERARVALARLLVKPGNLLLMDEPTTHLDLESAESLAASLETFDGTLVFVSHNRSFVRRLATRIWNVEHGSVETYPGTLDDYLSRHRPQDTETPARAVPDAEPSPAAPPGTAKPARAKTDRKARRREEARVRAERARSVGPLRQRVKELEGRIETLETQQRRRNLDLADPALYDDPPRRDALLHSYQQAAAELSELADAWERAQAELDAAGD